MFHINDGVVVVELIRTTLEAYVIHKVQAIHRLDQVVVLTLIQLPDHRLRGVQKHPLLEELVPVELHLNNELAPFFVNATHIDHTVLLSRILWHHLWRHVFHTGNLAVIGEWQQRIQQAHHQIRMLAKHQLKSQISFWIQILTTHTCVFFRFFYFDILHSELNF